MIKQRPIIVQTLKKYLREKGITYSQLASKLMMSEANIKRMFSKADLSLSRLDDICQIIGIKICELAARVEQEEKLIEELTLEQEKEILSEPKLQLLAYLLLQRISLEDITNNYDFTETELTRLLIKLDRIGIIELLPYNRIRSKVSQTFTWNKHGPIQDLFHNHIKTEFFNSKFEGKLDSFQFIACIISKETAEKIEALLKNVEVEIGNLKAEDKKILSKDKYRVSIALAAREYEYSAFKKFKSV